MHRTPLQCRSRRSDAGAAGRGVAVNHCDVSLNSPKKTKGESQMHRNEKGQFPKGQSGNGAGRPRGSRNKLGEAFIAELCADWTANGAAVIEQVRKEQPAAYLKIVAWLVPKELEIEDGPFDGFTDEELANLVACARNALGIPEEGDSGPGSAAH
jgi:hypothetical protein